MARINIEDTLFEDPRFFDLSVKLGSREAALGSLVLAWRVAQKCYIRSDRFIPFELWDKNQLKNEIIEVKLATRTDRFVKMSGIEEQFVWLIQRQIAGQKGGKKSGESRNKTKRPLAPDSKIEATVKPLSSVLSTQGNKNINILAELCDDDFEAVYKRYPRKLGKSDGMKRLKKTVKTPADFENLDIALDNFLKHHETEKTKLSFYPYFSTWTSSWADWINPDTTVDNSNQPDFSGIE